MKLQMILFCFVLYALPIGAQSVPTVATLHVKDDTGKPVSFLPIRGVFDGNPNDDKGFQITTDSNGVAIVRGELYAKLRLWLEKNGYYKTVSVYELSDTMEYLTLKKWEPEFNIQLRRIRNPIPLFVSEMNNPYVYSRTSNGDYNTNNFVQYDLMKADFLPPHGDGEVADMEFTWKMDIYKTSPKGTAIDYDTYFELLMPNEADGIMRGEPCGTGEYGSDLISDYEVLLEGYTNRISLYYKRKEVERFHAEFDTNNDSHYLHYLRVRTQTNELGQVTNAYYGKIYGPITDVWTYYLNLTSNDRNIEYDGKTNLNPKGERKGISP
jgi:hypothetical protein